MKLKFNGIIRPDRSVLATVATLNPGNPFCSSEYVSAKCALGFLPVALSIWEKEILKIGCIGFLSNGVFRKSLEVTSLPNLQNDRVFWSGIQNFCREKGIYLLRIESFASEAADIPVFSNEINRRQRFEYVLDLSSKDLFRDLSKNHKRNIKKGHKAKLIVQRKNDFKTFKSHLDLIDESMERRRSRGEDVPTQQNYKSWLVFLEHRVGEIFQALHNDKIMSSVLIFRTEIGAYYQSAGTLPEGMAIGASHFLISEVAKIIQKEGAKVFNLGGAGEESSGLRRFKAGFGAQEIPLESASFIMAPLVKRKLINAVENILSKVKSIKKYFD